ncbi:Exocyst complex component 6B [Chelonia mydas]|uniref:Exocyst complex component 6B n=1 Tax=Chelonia mydas TaxID=8469 RepID=M7BUT8_CHEMY|nr:Exocyst complex component 6B [Chelonia mydas]
MALSLFSPGCPGKFWLGSWRAASAGQRPSSEGRAATNSSEVRCKDVEVRMACCGIATLLRCCLQRWALGQQLPLSGHPAWKAAVQKSVYDGEEHGRFMEKLEARIRNHDREIEKMCNFHYQGFVDSITELLKVRGEAQKLKHQVTDTNRKLQSEGKELVVAMEELKQCRLQQRNISATVDKLTLCLPVLEMYSKLREQMKSKRHYPALKTLEHLEHTYLPQVSHYRFCKIMVDNIPKLREEIKDVSMSDLKDFLESIRKHSDKIGETAMKQRCEECLRLGVLLTGAVTDPCNPVASGFFTLSSLIRSSALGLSYGKTKGGIFSVVEKKSKGKSFENCHSDCAGVDSWNGSAKVERQLLEEQRPGCPSAVTL